LAPLPRYTPAGITIAAPQPVPIAGAQAAASAFNTLSNGIDRITNFAFRQAMQQAVVEGAEYGADKAPTIEQIKQAQEDGEPVNVPGDTTTVFGRAARSAALTNMRLNVESAARNELVQMHANILKTEVPADQYAAQMNNLIKGYGDAIASASPTAAGALRASLATIASMQYKVHATQLASKAEQRRKVEAEAAILNIIEGADNIVKAGDQFQDAFEPGDQIVIPSEAIAASERNKIIQLSRLVGDREMLTRNLQKFNDRMISAKKNIMVEYAKTADGYVDFKKYEELWSNEIKDLQRAALWNSLDDKRKQEVRDAVINANRQRTAIEEHEMSIREKRTQQEVSKTETRAIAALQNSDPYEQKAVLEEFIRLNAVKQYRDYTKLFAAGETWESNKVTIAAIEEQIRDNKATQDSLLNAFNNKLISPSDYTRLSNDLIAARDKVVRKYSGLFRDRVNYPEDREARLTMSESKLNIARRAFTSFHADLIEAAEKARLERKPFDPKPLFEKAYKGWKEENEEDDKSQTSSAKNLVGQLAGLTKYNIDPPTEKQLDDRKYVQSLLTKIEARKNKINQKDFTTYYRIVSSRLKSLPGK